MAVGLKCGFLCAAFALCLGGGFLPFAHKLDVHRGTASLVRCFGGGVLLSVGLVHMLSEGVSQLHSMSLAADCPVSLVTASASFLLMLLALRVVCPAKLTSDFQQVDKQDKAESDRTPLIAGSVVLVSLSLHSV